MYKKTSTEMDYITECGKRLGAILETLSTLVHPGVTALEIDQEAERLIREAGGVPAFKGYTTRKSDPPFPSTICASLNTELVHGIATKEKVIKDGDIFSIDIGMQYPAGSGEGQNGNGYFTDTAITLPIGDVPKDIKRLLAVTREALEVGIDAVQIGGTIADIGKAVETYVNNAGTYGIVRDLVGHGVGHAVHEDPRVPNVYDKDLESWRIEPGVVIAIEPMMTLGGHAIRVDDDGWTISPADQSLCAHFEHTIVVTESGPSVVTRRTSET